MSFLNGFLKTLGFEDENKTENRPAKENGAEYKLKNNKKDEKIVVCPTSQSEVQKITDILMDGKTVTVNLEKLTNTEFVRALDFLSGATYALNGKIKKLGEKIFSFIV